MKKTLLLIIPLFFLFVGCEDEQQKDCAGVEGGIAQVDSCGVCVGGTTDVIACVQDCSDAWGGNNICGCTDYTASNYNPEATYDDSSCLFHFSLIDLNPNSSTSEQTIGPADFLGDVCIVFFGHES